jgi:hypothetical protein
MQIPDADLQLVLAEDELRRRAIEGIEHITYDPKGNIKKRKRVIQTCSSFVSLRHDPRARRVRGLAGGRAVRPGRAAHPGRNGQLDRGLGTA